MTKTSSKNWYVSIIVVMIPFVLFNAGCSLFTTYSQGNNDDFAALGRKVDLLFDSMAILNTSNQEIEKEYYELKLEEERLSEEHAQIKEELLAIKKMIQEINQKLATLDYESDNVEESISNRDDVVEKIEKDEKEEEKKSTFSLNDFIEKTQKEEKRIPGPEEDGEKEKISSREVIVKKAEKIEKKTSPPKTIDHKAERPRKIKVSLTKEAREELKASIVEKLYNRGKTLYRQGRYGDAISKWERALVLDPEQLDAMYNIEVAKDRIKERKEYLAK